MAITQWMLAGSVNPDDVGVAVARWLRAARRAAAHDGLTGGMLFDGERWIQLLEGTPALVAELVGVLQRSGALGAPTVQQQIEAAGGRRACTQWRSGYVEPTVIDVLESALAGGVADAFTPFLSALNDADAL
jgi:hypothetical protein